MSWPAQETPFEGATPVKPLLLVDVDGVLNCFGSVWTPEYEAEHFVELPLAFDRYPIKLRKDVPDRIRRLSEHFEMVWGTAWSENAHPFWHAPLGLVEDEPWPHLTWTRGWVGAATTWKLPDVKKFADANPGRALAWIDDDLQADAYEWSNERITQGVPTLLVKTNPCDGLGEHEESRLMAFAGAAEAILSRTAGA